jgi:hypothetical protein
VAQTISHYGLWISIGLVVVIVFFQVRSQRHLMRTVGRASPAAAGGQASPAAAGGQASMAAQAGTDETGS